MGTQKILYVTILDFLSPEIVEERAMVVMMLRLEPQMHSASSPPPRMPRIQCGFYLHPRSTRIQCSMCRYHSKGVSPSRSKFSDV